MIKIDIFLSTDDWVLLFIIATDWFHSSLDEKVSMCLLLLISATSSSLTVDGSLSSFASSCSSWSWNWTVFLFFVSGSWCGVRLLLMCSVLLEFLLFFLKSPLNCLIFSLSSFDNDFHIWGGIEYYPLSVRYSDKSNSPVSTLFSSSLIAALLTDMDLLRCLNFSLSNRLSFALILAIHSSKLCWFSIHNYLVLV